MKFQRFSLKKASPVFNRIPMPKRNKKCANNTLVEYLQNLQRKAKHTRAQKLSFTYSKAIKSLKKYPIQINNGKEARVLEGVGPFISKKIDEYFNIDPNDSSSSNNLSTTSSSSSSDNSDVTIRSQTSSHFRQNNSINSSASSAISKSKSSSRTKTNNSRSSSNSRTSSKQYMPRYQSAAWAIMIAMYQLAKDNGDKYASWTKQEIIDEAQPLTETSFYTQSTGNGYHSGWSCMKSTLVKKGFVIYRGHPSMFRLTKDGFQLAKKLYNGEKRMQGQDPSDDELSSSSLSTETDSADSEERPRETSSQRSNENSKNLKNHRKQKQKQNRNQNRNQKQKQISYKNHQDDENMVNAPINVISSEDESVIDRMEVDTLSNSQNSLSSRSASQNNHSHEPYSCYREVSPLLFNNTDSPISFKNYTKPVHRNNMELNSDDSNNDNTDTDNDDNDMIIANNSSEYQVILALDQRERTRGSREYIFDHLLKYNVRVEKHALDLGDMLWIARHKNTGEEYVLNYIVERKATDDLASSIIDGRYMEQKYRLRQSGITNVFYLVEGDLSSQKRLPPDTLRSALVRTQICEGFFVKQTQNVDHSIEYLSILTRVIEYQIQQKGIKQVLLQEPNRGNNHSNENSEENEPIIIDENHSQENRSSKMSLTQFNKCTRKNGDLSLREIFGRQLASVYGCSADKAIAIMEKYPTPSSLAEAYDACGTDKRRKELLKDIQIANDMASRPKVGTSLSSFIDLLYNTPDKYT